MTRAEVGQVNAVPSWDAVLIAAWYDDICPSTFVLAHISVGHTTSSSILASLSHTETVHTQRDVSDPLGRDAIASSYRLHHS